MSSSIAPAFDMGELWLTYTQYREAVDSRGLHEKHYIAVDPSIAQEDFQRRLSGLKIVDAATVDLAEIASSVQKKQVGTRHMDLLERGFAGTITGLFDRIMAASYAVNHVGLPLESVVDPEEQAQIVSEIALYSAIPAERRRGAKVVDEGRAYYWGGRYTLMPIVEVDPVVEADASEEPRNIHEVVAAAKAAVVTDGGAEPTSDSGSEVATDDMADDTETEVRTTGLRLVHSEPNDK